MKRTALAALLVAGVAYAQVTRTETQSVLVDVLVTDKKGNRVPDLKTADFQVFEDGKEQALDGIFTETAVSGANHSVIVLFDNAAMTSSEQVWARQTAAQLLDEFAAGNANIAILDFSGALRVTQTFTQDVTRAKQAVARTAPGSAGIASVTTGNGAVSNEYAVRDLLRSLEGLVTNLQGAAGRKSIIFFSPGYTMTSEYGSRVDQIVGAANRSNVSIYPVNTRIPGASDSTGVAGIGAPAATSRRGATISASRGLSGPGAEPQSDAVPTGPGLLPILRDMAESTGGILVLQPNDRAALSRIAKEQTEFYILSYSPPESPEGSCHKLRVKVKRGGVNVRSREGYCKRAPGTLRSGTPAARALEARAAAAQSGNITATMQAPYFYKAPNLARAAAVLEVQTSNLAFTRVKDKFVGQMEVLGIATLEDGSSGARFTDVVKWEFDTQAEVDRFKSQSYRYENQFDIGPGVYKLSVALGGGGENFAKLEAPLEVAAFNGNEFALSAIALSREYRQQDSSALSGLDEFLIDDRKKLISDGIEIVPAGSNKLSVKDKAAMFIEIHEPLLIKPDPAQPLLIAFQMRILEQPSSTVKIDTGGIRLDLSTMQKQSVIPLALALPVETLVPGNYILEFQAFDSAGKTARRTAAFKIE